MFSGKKRLRQAWLTSQRASVTANGGYTGVLGVFGTAPFVMVLARRGAALFVQACVSLGLGAGHGLGCALELGLSRHNIVVLSSKPAGHPCFRHTVWSCKQPFWDSIQVDRGVMDWVTMQRRAKPRTQQWKQEEEGCKNRRMVEIFVAVSILKTFLLEVSPNDKVGDVVRQIPSCAGCSRRDVYVTCEGRVLRRSDGLKKEEQSREETGRGPKETGPVADVARVEGRGRTEERQRSSDSGGDRRK